MTIISSGNVILNSVSALTSGTPGTYDTNYLLTGPTIDSDFLGAQPDSVATVANASGQAPLASIVDWAALEHRHRVWGPATGTGPCTGTCQVFDLTPSLAKTPNAALNAFGVPTAAGLVTHTWTATTEAECDLVEPNAWIGSSCQSQFHPLGIETEVPSIPPGDGDGLCEAGEACIRVRNAGAYQGHGALTPTPGNFDFGAAGTYHFFDHAENGR
jgi:hypothetical protein